MGRPYTAYDVTGFLDDSIGSFLNDIESIAIEMSKTDDYEERAKMATDIQEIIWQCNSVLR
jgi:hypothetical protein